MDIHPAFDRHREFIIHHTGTLLDSFRQMTGRDLIARGGSEEDEARRLFEAPFVVVSATKDPQPVLNYANAAALKLWESDWESLTAMEARKTAEPMEREARAAFLDEVRRKGYISNYQGIRISATGNRFLIEEATVWNLIQDDTYHGQAATFANWTPCQAPS